MEFLTDEEPIKRTEENAECEVCCTEQSDYVCSRCNYALCSTCIHHLKHSTAMCPQCRLFPLSLKRIENGKTDIETENENTIEPSNA